MALLTFSEDALFYEEAYTNAPNDVVARRHSTNVTVRVSASGGPHGGVFNLTRTGFDKLSFVEGDPLPEEIITLAPNETRSWCAEYAPCVHSATKDDVTLSARFDEHLTGNTLSDEDKMTVVKVELSPVVMRSLMQLVSALWVSAISRSSRFIQQGDFDFLSFSIGSSVVLTVPADVQKE